MQSIWPVTSLIDQPQGSQFLFVLNCQKDTKYGLRLWQNLHRKVHVFEV
jgi:hypothetical protein